MDHMVVMLDVSKLSGWLNADAYCRVERRTCDAGRGAAREAGGRWVGGDASGTHGEGPTQGLGARARAERTWNIYRMSVMLDVSKLSGWLNAAYCRVEERACDAERGLGPEGGRAYAGGSARAACTARGPGCEGWAS